MYAQKEDLLHEVLELEAEKGLLASGESTKYQVGVTWYHISREESVSRTIGGFQITNFCTSVFCNEYVRCIHTEKYVEMSAY